MDDGVQVFESEDVSEEKGIFSVPVGLQYQDRQRDPDVVTITYDPAASFAKFTQTYLDTSDTDFTDKAVKDIYTSQVTNGFQLKRTGQRFESPKERFDRISAELAEFKKELAQLESVKSFAELSKSLAAEATSLESDMKAVSGNNKYKHFLDTNYPLTPAHVGLKNASKDLSGKLSSTGKFLAQEKKAKEKQANKGISYEFYGAGAGNTRKVSDVVTLDKRMNKLERTIGRQKLKMLPDLRNSLLYLAKKMELLGKDSQRLDDCNKKMILLTTEIQGVNKERAKMKAVTTSGHQNQVDELYDMLVGWDQAGATLPFVSARVQALKDMTDAAKGSNARVDKAQTEKDKMAKGLKDADAQLKAVKKDFAATLSKMGKVSAVEKDFSQIAALAKKLK